MKKIFLSASSILLLLACKRDMVPASQQGDLTGQFARAVTATAGTVPSFPVQTAFVSTVLLQAGAINITSMGGVATDAGGNIYIADKAADVIRKVGVDGSYSIFAGNGVSGFQNGAAPSAEFNDPEGLAFDAQGNLYVADMGNNRIRIIAPNGNVGTYAGSGTAGFADGPDSVAKFNQPTGVAVDGSGVVYVADFYNQRIRRVLKTKTVSTWAGSGNATHADGAGALASFSYPFGITITPAGTAYVTDFSLGYIRKIVGGVVSTLAGNGQSSFADGTGAQASFHTPKGISVDAAGNVYVVDALNNRVRKITAAGVVTTLAGKVSGTMDGYDGDAAFGNINGLAISPAGDIYIGDSGNRKVRKLNVLSAVKTLAGNGSTDYLEGTGAGAHINAPYSITIAANGLLYFEDGNHRVRTCTPAGTTSFLAGGSTYYGKDTGPGDSIAFNSATGLLPDAAGNVYVADGNFQAIRKIDLNGFVTTFASDPVNDPSFFHFISSLDFDPSGNMIFTAYNNGRIRKLSPAGVVTRVDSLPIPDSTTLIYASTTDAAGNLYVPDAGTGRIYKVTPQGTHSLFFGGQVPPPSIAGGPFQPRGLAVDAKGNVYVADFANNSIVIFNKSGQYVSQIGVGTPAFADGVLWSASFNHPTWIAINRATGILYIADQSNNRIRMMSQL
jgi:sugar lactone lactonase YvrE